MTILGRFTPMNGQATLINAMISKLGLSRQMHQLPGNRAVMQWAAQRCLDCSNSGACQEWLASADMPGSAPDYCRNHDLFERVIAKIKVEKPASSPL